MSRRSCNHWDGTAMRRCSAVDGVHLYPAGWRCGTHSPAAIAGRPEPPEGPGWPAGAWTTPPAQGVASVIDERAVASGKRRSNPQAYRAARAAVHGDPPP